MESGKVDVGIMPPAAYVQARSLGAASAIKAVVNGQVDACFVFEGARYVFKDVITDEAGLEIMSSWGHTGYVVADEKAYDTIETYIANAGE